MWTEGEAGQTGRQPFSTFHTSLGDFRGTIASMFINFRVLHFIFSSALIFIFFTYSFFSNKEDESTPQEFIKLTLLIPNASKIEFRLCDFIYFINYALHILTYNQE